MSTHPLEDSRILGANGVAYTPETDAGDWEAYLEFEADRRGVSVEVVRAEEEAAKRELEKLVLDRDKLYAAARASVKEHPYLVDDEAPSS